MTFGAAMICVGLVGLVGCAVMISMHRTIMDMEEREGSHQDEVAELQRRIFVLEAARHDLIFDDQGFLLG